jgi:hypothetical protein
MGWSQLFVDVIYNFHPMGFFCLFRLIHEILKFGFKISILNEYRILREAGG